MLVGIVTFAVGLALCVAIFVALDVKMLFLVGPVMGIAIAAYSAYRSARAERAGIERPTGTERCARVRGE